LAKNPEAVSRLCDLKQRERKPGSVIAANIQQLVDMGLDEQWLSLINHYWPAAISIVTPAGSNLDYLHQGVDSLALRIPTDKAIHKLLLKTGPIITSSVNQPRELPANNISEAIGLIIVHQLY
jgi:tRNA A37 threonylcarbamoyladenosine synthetase subunit TsaC/SUA5/YrdC